MGGVSLGTGKYLSFQFPQYKSKRLRRKSFCLTSWMTLSLDLVNKCSLSSSCVPSARITHNPGTEVDHNQAGRKAEM